MKIIKTKNGLQVRELSKKQAQQEDAKFGVFCKEAGDYEAFTETVDEAMEWLYPEYSMLKESFEDFMKRQESKGGL